MRLGVSNLLWTRDLDDAVTAAAALVLRERHAGDPTEVDQPPSIT